MSTRRLAAALALLWLPLPATAADDAPPVQEVELPLTIERVWFKPSRRLISSGGDLTISDEGLELVTGKKTVLIPLDELYGLSYGRYKSDVDTEWSVLGIGESGPATLLGIRDGKKLGYGQRTRQIYETLRAAMRRLRVAQWDVPQGYVTYEALAKQFTLAVPGDWHTHLGSLVVDGEGRSWGVATFSAERIDYAHRTPGEIEHLDADPDLRRVRSGEIPAFFVSSRRIESGMDCDGFSKKARERLIQRERERTTDAFGFPLIEPFRLSEQTVGFCAGFRLDGRVRRPDGQELRVELYLVAHHRSQFVLGLRALEEIYPAARERLDVALATLRFSLAR
jgi:hypothetical protein